MAETHRIVMAMVYSIALGPQAILFKVILIARNAGYGSDELDMSGFGATVFLGQVMWNVLGRHG